MLNILLVNPNLMQPPVTPVALDHLGQHLRDGGFGVELLDLGACPGIHAVEAAIDDALRRDWLLVAVTVRNVDDSFAASRDFCLARTKGLIDRIRAGTDAPVVLGGVGFSIFPRAALAFCEAPYAVRGEGEEPLLRLARCLAEGRPPDDVPGLLALRDGRIVLDNPPFRHDLAAMPAWRRDVVDNPRYLAEGGQVGFETKRGCPRACAYCADPVAKGTRLVARTPMQVADELEALLRQGVNVFHTCDAEFNVPRSHALAVCAEMARRGLCDRIRWYAYAVPDGFDDELAAAMQRAGCAGIDFTADHTEPQMLAALGRSHTEADLRGAAAACHVHGIPFMFDLLLGGPGESRDSLRRCIEALKEMNPSRVGTSLGVRLYPGTSLAHRLGRGDDEEGLLRPTYYIEPTLGPDIHGYVRDLIGEDERFLFPSGGEGAANYNYNDNSALCAAIRRGARGAFWDILRREAQGPRPETSL
jgi:tryptophan 2-C-methyltransferase